GPFDAKKYLQVSVDDLHIVHKKISLALENQHKEIKTMIAQKTIQIPQAQNKLFYTQVITKVFAFMLKKVYKQFLIVSNTTKNPLQSCSGTFKSSIGLPCSHKIQELLEDNQCLQLDDFYQYWWIQQYQLPQQTPPKTKDPLQQK
ncbi:13301_t:CDS:1, partial [Gigaspora margarita]